ncbi:DUF2971 domain-containing protein [Rahnella inusitata]|uniref:DUF2971 domain-containing protein n=1 Tax=Rahnella inusitata TaxID=58169 RepID=UPI0039BDCB18
MTLTKVPDKLYKFKPFSVNSLELIVADNLYFANPSNFNDPLDCKPCIVDDMESTPDTLIKTVAKIHLRSLVNEIEKAAKKLFIDDEPFHQKIISAIDTNLHNHIAEIRASYEEDDITSYHDYLIRVIEDQLLSSYNKGILSLSEKNSCPLMWSHYADEHKGFCLGYKIPENKKEYIRAVNYDGDRIIKTSQLVRMFSINPNEIFAIDDTVLLNKGPSWRYEHEWRMFDKPGIRKSELHLKDVIFGLRFPLAARHSVIKALENRYEPIDFYQITVTPGKFDLQPVPIASQELKKYPYCNEEHRVNFAEALRKMRSE